MASIQAIAAALPEAEVTNEDLDRENPSWRMDLVAEITGIDSRRVAADDETPFDLSVRACDELLARPGVDAKGIDAILCCVQDPDYRGIANACLLHERLGLGDNVLAFDFPLSCSGFVYGLAMADAFLCRGAASRALLVTAETPTKHINPRDRSTQVLLGDGATACLLSATDGTGGRVVAYELCTHGGGYKYAYAPAGGARSPGRSAVSGDEVDSSGNVRTAEECRIHGNELWSFVSSTVPSHVEAFLAGQSLTLEDVDMVVFHQASKMIIDSLTKAMKLPREKVFVEMADVGNLSSSSIPYALGRALDQGAIRSGDRVLLSAFGAGISYGSALVEF